MQWRLVALSAVLGGGADLGAAAVRLRFGPANCVSVERSTEGTCVLETQCAGRDISDYDFSFTCLADSKTVTHSYGKGSMDEVEEYDTGVPCDECRAPSAQGLRGAPRAVAKAPPVPVAQSQVVAARHAVNVTAASAAGAQSGAQSAIAVTDISAAEDVRERMTPIPVTPAAAAAVPGAVPADAIAHFGPAGCVSAWRAPQTGQCQLSTACATGVDLSTYEFGLLCVDAGSNVTRHLFGRGSFDNNETFDTGIVCSHCLGLDSPDAQTVFGLGDRVLRLEGSITQMTGEITWLQGEVRTLQAARAASPSPAPVSLVKAAARVHGSAAHEAAEQDDDYDDDPNDNAF